MYGSVSSPCVVDVYKPCLRLCPSAQKKISR
jgi:hypothetical protein